MPANYGKMETTNYLVGVDRKSKLFDPSRVDAVGSTGEGRMSKEGGLRIQLIQKCDRCLSVRNWLAALP
jgi:hypothetical protein